MASCISAITIRLKSGTGKSVQVPCGRCLNCLKRRSNGWAFRLMQQYKDEDHPAFMVTLTYDSDHVPITTNGFMSLRKKDIQDFMKRLRFHSKQKIKYYCSGEYGGRYGRPHYHIIMFGLPVIYYQMLEEIWSNGSIHLIECNEATVGYTLKYITKQRWKPRHSRDDREPPKSLMSKRLGKCYVTPEIVGWHKDDLVNRMYVVMDGNVKCSMPRYYKNLIYDSLEREIIGCFNEDRQVIEDLSMSDQDIRNRIEYHKHSYTQILPDDSVVF